MSSKMFATVTATTLWFIYSLCKQLSDSQKQTLFVFASVWRTGKSIRFFSLGWAYQLDILSAYLGAFIQILDTKHIMFNLEQNKCTVRVTKARVFLRWCSFYLRFGDTDFCCSPSICFHIILITQVRQDLHIQKIQRCWVLLCCRQSRLYSNEHKIIKKNIQLLTLRENVDSKDFVPS